MCSCVLSSFGSCIAYKISDEKATLFAFNKPDSTHPFLYLEDAQTLPQPHSQFLRAYYFPIRLSFLTRIWCVCIMKYKEM